jgi:DNA-binding response OmpR family regulator
MSDVPGAGGSSGGTLRRLSKTGHGAVKFGVAANAEAFAKEIQTALLNPNKWITWVDSKPWDFEMLDGETEQTQVPTRIIEPPTQVTKPRGTLLIVDGEDGPRESLCAMFEDEYELFLAEDGPEAIALAMQNDVDVVVLDTLAGKEMSGMDVLKQIKFVKPDIAVIVMTAFETTDTLRRALQLRASDYICKPFELATMRAAVSKAIQSRTQARELAAAQKKASNNLGITAKQRLFKRRGKLLVLDDEEGPRQALRQIFEGEYNVLLAEDGPTAIRLAQENDVDVAVLDIRIGGISGLDVLERIKSFKPDIEAIMITGFETNDCIRDSLRLGACDYINKPFEIATMRAAVNKAMQRRTRQSGMPDARNEAKSNFEAVGILDDTKDAGALYQESLANKSKCNFERANGLLRKAAELGHPQAMFDCGMDYGHGDSGPQDPQKSIYWLKKSAEKDYPDAQLWIGLSYSVGLADLPQDLPEAYKWLKLASEKNRVQEPVFADLLTKMTPEQIGEGERRYREFRS